MNKNKHILVGIILMGAILLTACQPKKIIERNKEFDELNTSSKQTESLNSNTENLPIKPFEKEKIDRLTPKKLDLGLNAGLKEYTGNEIITASKGKNPLALYFGEKDCQLCQKMEKQIELFKTSVPNQIILAKLDFVSEAETAGKLGVEMPGIWIIFDKEGNEVARNAGIDFNSLLIDLIKAL